MRSNVTPPLLSLTVESTSVRAILNELAHYTLIHASKDRNSYATSSETAEIAPTGWRVYFEPNDKARRGLRGYVKWSSFP